MLYVRLSERYIPLDSSVGKFKLAQEVWLYIIVVN